MLNSHQRCSDSSILCINAKPAHSDTWTNFSGELISEDNYRFSPSEFFQYRTGLYLGQRRRRRIRGGYDSAQRDQEPTN